MSLLDAKFLGSGALDLIGSAFYTNLAASGDCDDAFNVTPGLIAAQNSGGAN